MGTISKDKIKVFKEQIRRSLKKKRDKKKYLDIPPPVYDDIYFEGVEWLDKNG